MAGYGVCDHCGRVLPTKDSAAVVVELSPALTAERGTEGYDFCSWACYQAQARQSD